MVAKVDLPLLCPLMNAAGTLGLAPNLRGVTESSKFGAFVTNPISLSPRTAASGVRFLAYPGGFLLHTGYPNPGLKAAARQYAGRWARSPLPVIVHLLSQTVDEVAVMARLLEGLEGVAGLELGLPKDVDAKAAAAFTRAAQGERPVVTHLPLKNAENLAPAAIEAGAVAVSLAAPRGTLPTPEGRLVQGRLYGPGIFPLALAVTRNIAQAGMPVIGAGGIYRPQQIKAMLDAGAMAVQIDSLLWKGVSPILETNDGTTYD